MNTLLRKARQQAKLTQEELASILGTTTVSIWRWENGGVPSPFFRKAICAYFQLSPAEFGWPPPKRRGGSQKSAFSFLVDPSIPGLGDYLVGQQPLLTQLQGLLCSTCGPQRVGLTGLVGSGKTAIAQQLSTAPQLQEMFAGVFWASLGPEAHPMCHLHRWANLLGLDTLPPSLSAAQDLLHTAIGQHRVLFVLDDVWRQEDVVPFRLGGPTCRYLVTTRQPGLARLLCQQVWQVQDLSESEAFALLVADFPMQAVREHTTQLHQLIQSVGKHPQALVLMREYLRRDAHMQPPRRFRETLLRLAQRGRHPEAPDILQMEAPWQSQTLSAAIHQNEQHLTTSAWTTFRLLAKQFQDMPFTESEAAGLLHGRIQQELDCLMDAGLLTWSESGCYRFHPILVEYACLTESNQRGEDTLLETHQLSETVDHGRSQLPVELAARRAAREKREKETA